MSLDTNVNSSLIENKQKRDAAKAASQPVIEPVTPITTNTITIPAPTSTAPTPTVEPKKEEAVPPVTSKQPDESTQPEVKPTVTEPVELIDEFKWDSNIPDVTPTTESTVSADLKKIGSALKLEVNNEQEFVSKVTEKLTRLDQLEALSLDGIPDQLKQAITVAKQGGDWLAVTGVTAFDAANLDPTELFERDYERANAHRFKLADGSTDYTALDAEVDGIAPGIKVMSGTALKNALVQHQQQQKAAVLAQAAVQQERFQTSLAAAARDLSGLLPKEEFGITLEPKHTSFFYQGVSDGSLIKKHLGDIDPAALMKMDSKKLMKTLALAELGKGISEFQRKQGIVEGKKSMLQSTTNAQLQAPSTLPRPNDPAPVAQPTSAERLKKMKETNQPVNSL